MRCPRPITHSAAGHPFPGFRWTVTCSHRVTLRRGFSWSKAPLSCSKLEDPCACHCHAQAPHSHGWMQRRAPPQTPSRPPGAESQRVPGHEHKAAPWHERWPQQLSGGPVSATRLRVPSAALCPSCCLALGHKGVCWVGRAGPPFLSWHFRDVTISSSINEDFEVASAPLLAPRPVTSKGVRTEQPLASDHNPLPAEVSGCSIWFSLDFPARNPAGGRQQGQPSCKTSTSWLATAMGNAPLMTTGNSEVNRTTPSPAPQEPVCREGMDAASLQPARQKTRHLTHCEGL